MSVIAIIVALVVISLAVGAIGTRQGWFSDANDNDIPDAIEDAADKVVEEVKERIEDVKEEVADVVSAIKGKPTKAKLNALTKKQLVEAAKADFGEDIDISLKKSNIVNKVYALYNK
jgi:uncharacterized protein YjbJ (UPF0337 family)